MLTERFALIPLFLFVLFSGCAGTNAPSQPAWEELTYDVSAIPQGGSTHVQFMVDWEAGGDIHGNASNSAGEYHFRARLDPVTGVVREWHGPPQMQIVGFDGLSFSLPILDEAYPTGLWSISPDLRATSDGLPLVTRSLLLPILDVGRKAFPNQIASHSGSGDIIGQIPCAINCPLTPALDFDAKVDGTRWPSSLQLMDTSGQGLSYLRVGYRAAPQSIEIPRASPMTTATQGAGLCGLTLCEDGQIPDALSFQRPLLVAQAHPEWLRFTQDAKGRIAPDILSLQRQALASGAVTWSYLLGFGDDEGHHVRFDLLATGPWQEPGIPIVVSAKREDHQDLASDGGSRSLPYQPLESVLTVALEHAEKKADDVAGIEIPFEQPSATPEPSQRNRVVIDFREGPTNAVAVAGDTATILGAIHKA